MKDFQKLNNFKKVSAVLGLLKKVMDQDKDDKTKYKVKADFIKLLKKRRPNVLT
jgi:hypothetical protein